MFPSQGARDWRRALPWAADTALRSCRDNRSAGISRACRRWACSICRGQFHLAARWKISLYRGADLCRIVRRRIPGEWIARRCRSSRARWELHWWFCPAHLSPVCRASCNGCAAPAKSHQIEIWNRESCNRLQSVSGNPPRTRTPRPRQTKRIWRFGLLDSC